MAVKLGTTTRRTAVLAAVAGLALMGGGGMAIAGTTSQANRQVLFRDDFKSGFDTTNTWLLFATKTATGATLPQGDGVVTTSRHGITIVPTGTNPRTGQPAFAATVGPDATGFGGGTGDHLKWVMQPKQSAANGVDVPATGAMVCTSTMGARATGIEQHPFGSVVSDPQSDPRLASSTLISVDHGSHTVANLTVTNTEIHAIYERLPVEGSTYASYHFSIPVARRYPGELDKLQIRFDHGGQRVSWLVNNRVVLSTDRIGTLAFDRKFLRIDHGGTEQQVSAQHVQCGIGTGNLLDGGGGVHDRDKRAPVRLDGEPNFYFSPKLGPPSPQTFVDDTSQLSNRLWGQGVIVQVRDFDMSYVD